MAHILLKYALFNLELENFCNSPSDMNLNLSSVEGCELETLKGYISRFDKLVSVLLTFKYLIEKDANDMATLAGNLIKADAMSAGAGIAGKVIGGIGNLNAGIGAATAGVAGNASSGGSGSFGGHSF